MTWYSEMLAKGLIERVYINQTTGEVMSEEKAVATLQGALDGASTMAASLMQAIEKFAAVYRSDDDFKKSLLHSVAQTNGLLASEFAKAELFQKNVVTQLASIGNTLTLLLLDVQEVTLLRKDIAVLTNTTKQATAWIGRALVIQEHAEKASIAKAKAKAAKQRTKAAKAKTKKK